jgi:hypothetical protein
MTAEIKIQFLVLGTVFDDACPLDSQHKLGLRVGGWWPDPVTKVFTNACVSIKFPNVDYTGIGGKNNE